MNYRTKAAIAALITSGTLLLAQPVMAEVYAQNPNLGNTPMEGTATFEAFGGKEGLVKIMDDFMIGLVADPRTKPFFDNNKQTFIKAMLVEQMCELMNGGCKYPGRDMKASHANMKVNREGFNALVEQFQFAMDKHNVPFSAQNKLLAKLAPMYREIETTTGDAVPPVFAKEAE
ncbi:MAG: group 1 truncated hemoglobin [Pseudomonadota bacterium]